MAASAPDRIIIETSGSAFPATLAMEVNRLGRETGNYVLDGVIVVIDVENWKGYDDTSYTAKMQARYTDLIVFNKWELVDERRYEDCLDRMGDLEIQVASVKSDKGRVDQSVILGMDNALANADESKLSHAIDHGISHDHAQDHQSEVEVLSITLSSQNTSQGVKLEALGKFLTSAPKDEIYRIKAIVQASRLPESSESISDPAMSLQGKKAAKYILNWAFGRWAFSPISTSQSRFVEPSTDVERDERAECLILQMTVILARYEAAKWKNRIETDRYLLPEEPSEKSALRITRLM
ncbi:MAG: hypothetical protein Q9217_002456 [Psora testacea]